MRRIEGILFDLGDTLLDFGVVDVQSMFQQGGRLAYQYLSDLKLPLPSYKRFYRRQLWAIRWSYFKSRFTRREFNALDVLGRQAADMGHDLTPEQTVQLAWMWYAPLSRQARVEDNARKVLCELRDAGLTIGLVSNTFVPGEVLDRHLQQVNLLDLLPIRVYSCDVAYRKPHPSIFAMALERTGLRAASTLFVGDSPDADILGANRAGLISVLKDPLNRHARSKIKPAHRINRLEQLSEIVAQYNGGDSSPRRAD